jgi:hypothetical protein
MRHVCSPLLLFALVSAVTHAGTIGDSVIPRSFFDSGAGQVFIFGQAFPNPGEQVVSWTFFSDLSATNCCQSGPATMITPLLFDQTGSSIFTLIGIGTTQTNALTGAQTFSFGLTSGTDTVGTNTFFGWKDGAPVGDNPQGVVEYNDPGASNYFYLGQGVDAVVGNAYTSLATVNREYSIQFTTAPVATPEPGSLGLVGLSICMAAILNKRRRTKF